MNVTEDECEPDVLGGGKGFEPSQYVHRCKAKAKDTG